MPDSALLFRIVERRRAAWLANPLDLLARETYRASVRAWSDARVDEARRALRDGGGIA